ncbi:hypothetical protein F2Q70_00008721 [Brassica cretica]|uniref:Uncharacterized protein n=2 Tax=Brassica cretica TaxID=69181 RepID=A0A8S9MAW2_BRACR|nr:hypothetical protein F2Q70_00008721 [Brassica cretica]
MIDSRFKILHAFHELSPFPSKQIELAKLKIEMAMPLEMAMYLTKTVWFALSGWIFTCLCIADEIAGSLRNRESSLSMSDD